jgi:hypothetical protein
MVIILLSILFLVREAVAVVLPIMLTVLIQVLQVALVVVARAGRIVRAEAVELLGKVMMVGVDWLLTHHIKIAVAVAVGLEPVARLRLIRLMQGQEVQGLQVL